MRRAVLFAIKMYVKMYVIQKALCITCVAQKPRNGFELGKHHTNRSTKHFILIYSRAVYGAGNGSYSRFSGRERTLVSAYIYISQGGWSALLWAAYRGHSEVVTLLLEAGANADLQAAVHTACSASVYINCVQCSMGVHT